MAVNEAEVRRKALAGIPLTNPTPESTALYESIQKWNAEIQRKAQAGIPLTNPTPEAQKLYDQYRSQYTQTSAAPTSSATMPAPVSQPVPAGQTTQSAATVQPRFQNQYLTDAQKLIAQLQHITSQPFTFTQQDLENDPAYIASQKLAAEAAKTASSRTEAEMNRRGILNSSITANKIAQLQQEAALKPLELVPQLQQQAFQRYQSGIQNQAAIANMLMNLGINERNFQATFPLQEAAITGQYIPGEVRRLVDTILNLKRQAEGGASPEQLAGLRSQADAARQQLYTYGIDADALFGADVPLAQAAQNASGIGRLTTDAQTALLNTILGLGQTYGSLPAGTGAFVGGLPMYSGLAGMLGNLEGQPTLAKQAQDFQQKLSILNYNADRADQATRNAIQQAQLRLTELKTQQDIGYQNWLMSKGISELVADRNTNAFIAQLLDPETSIEEAISFVVDNTADIQKGGMNVDRILDALNMKLTLMSREKEMNQGQEAKLPQVDPVRREAMKLYADSRGLHDQLESIDWFDPAVKAQVDQLYYYILANQK